jgi:hypothetical protein
MKTITKIALVLLILFMMRCSVTMVVGTSNRVDVAADKELDTGLDVDLSKTKDTIK